MADIPSSPATFSVGPGAAPPDDQNETLSFAIPSGVYTSAIWILGGTSTNDASSQKDNVKTPSQADAPGRVAGLFGYEITATAAQLVEINAAAGGNLSVDFHSGADFSNPFWYTNVSQFILRLTQSGGGGGGNGNGTGTGNGSSIDPGGSPKDPCDDPRFKSIGRQQFATAEILDDVYYLSTGGGLGETLGYDMHIQGWFDSMYGTIYEAVRVDLPNYDPILFMYSTPPNDSVPFIQHTSKAYVPSTPETIYGGDIPRLLLKGAREVHLGPYDGMGPDRTRLKQALCHLLYGEYDVPNDAVVPTLPIGTLTLVADSGYSEKYDIWPLRYVNMDGPRVYPPGTISVQEFSQAMIGRVLYAKVVLNVDCVRIRESVLEYCRIE